MTTVIRIVIQIPIQINTDCVDPVQCCGVVVDDIATVLQPGAEFCHSSCAQVYTYNETVTIAVEQYV